MTGQADRPTCEAATKSGKPCSNFVWVGSDGVPLRWCYFHAPAHASHELNALRDENRRRGGQRGHDRIQVDLKRALSGEQSVTALVETLASTMAALAEGRVSARTGTALASLANALGRALEIRDLQGRLSELEKLTDPDAALPEALREAVQGTKNAAVEK